MDLYLAVYPATVLWKLQMNMKKKLGLSAALGFGIVATIVAAYKCTKLPGLAGADYSCKCPLHHFRYRSRFGLR